MIDQDNIIAINVFSNLLQCESD